MVTVWGMLAPTGRAAPPCDLQEPHLPSFLESVSDEALSTSGQSTWLPHRRGEGAGHSLTPGDVQSSWRRMESLCN